LDILVIAIYAIIAGVDNWEDVAEFGQAKVEWFKKFSELPNGFLRMALSIEHLLE